jgi:hypothetical protein
MLKGLEYKLKSESSLFRKIMSDLDEEKAKDDGGLDVRKPPFFGFFGGGAFFTKNDRDKHRNRLEKRGVFRAGARRRCQVLRRAPLHVYPRVL